MPITPSKEACKNFVCNILPGILLDLQRKGKLPPEYMSQRKPQLKGKQKGAD